MRIPRIYTQQALAEEQIIELEAQASQHLAKALRLKEGHPIILFNGEGGEFKAEITSVSKKHVVAKCLQFASIDIESPLQIHLVIALSKGDKMEMIVQKATELGVCSIIPVLSERSDVKLNAERREKKQRQWQQIAISACEQSGRNYVPQVEAIQGLDNCLSQIQQGLIAIFHTIGGEPLSRISKQQLERGLYCCFGSEGGFTEEEVKQVLSQGGKSLTLGHRILRAETAPIAVMGAAQALWGDWL